MLDPNTYRKDGTAGLGGRSVSWNGKLSAYSIAQAGSDWSEWHIRNVASGKDLPDVIRSTKGTDISWTADDEGFYYSRYPEPPPEKLLTLTNADQKVYFHRLGDQQSEDKLIYSRPDHPTWVVAGDLLEGGRYLMLYAASGASGRNLLAFQDLKSKPGNTVDLIAVEDTATGLSPMLDRCCTCLQTTKRRAQE